MYQLSVFDVDVGDNLRDSLKLAFDTVPSGVNYRISNGMRPGLKDIWNAFMAEGASFGKYDIPFCPTTATGLPNALIIWEEAKAIYKKYITRGKKSFHIDAFVCFYIDDYKFDGARGIWYDWKRTLKILSHFAGVITPDFSTYQDFPEAIKIYATYRMRLYGYWLGKNGISVINNVRWGTEETYEYCFEGIPQNSIVAIGVVASGLKCRKNRCQFENGITELVRELSPHAIIVYGSANYPIFEKIKAEGIVVVEFPSETSKRFQRRNEK